MDGAQRMRTMIEDLLNYSRIGRGNNEFETTDLNDMLNEALANLSVAIEESHADIRAGHLPMVHGLPSLLLRLMQNLIRFAIEAGVLASGTGDSL